MNHNLRLLLFAFFIATTLSLFPQSTWSVQTSDNEKNIWNSMGLSTMQGHCSWYFYQGAKELANNQKILTIQLYRDISSADNYLQILIYFPLSDWDGATNSVLQSNSTLYVEYYSCIDQTCSFNSNSTYPAVHLSNSTVIIVQQNGQKMTINLTTTIFSSLFIALLSVYLAIKLNLIVLFTSQFRILNSGGSYYGTSIIAGAGLFGWQFIHIMGILFFMVDSVTSSAIKIILYLVSSVFSILMIGILVFMYRHRRHHQHPSVIFLSVAVLILEIGCYFAPIEVDIILFSLIPLLQIGYNIFNTSASPMANLQRLHLLPPLLLYLSSFPFIVYTLGCPANAKRNHLNYQVIYIVFSLAIFQLIILWYQGGSLKCHYQQIGEIFPQKIKDANILNDSIVSLHELSPDAKSKECCICLQLFDTIQPISKTKCNHIFHTKCLLEWVRRNNICPFDRNPLFKGD